MNVIFIPECYADTTLTDFFLKDNKLVIHQRGISKVAAFMERSGSKYARLVGIIDADKRQPLYFKDFKEKKRIGNVVLKQKNNSEQYLIVLQPELERFLITCSEELKLDLADFNLPTELQHLIDITKNVSVANNHNFKRLLKALLESEDFKGLGQLLISLKEI